MRAKRLLPTITTGWNLFNYHSRDDQAYELGLDYGKTRVYCHMSSIPGCDAGGYTLVMKIDGSAVSKQNRMLTRVCTECTPVGFILRFLSSLLLLIHSHTHPSVQLIQQPIQPSISTFHPPIHPSIHPPSMQPSNHSNVWVACDYFSPVYFVSISQHFCTTRTFGPSVLCTTFLGARRSMRVKKPSCRLTGRLRSARSAWEWLQRGKQTTWRSTTRPTRSTLWSPMASTAPRLWAGTRGRLWSPAPRYRWIATRKASMPCQEDL